MSRTTAALDGRGQRHGLFPTLLAVAGLCLGCGPIGPFSGGRLSGDLGPPDFEAWSMLTDRDAETLNVETNPDDPHSVTTWFVIHDSKLYVPTSMVHFTKNPTQRSWVRNVEADPNVRIRLGGVVFERVAVRLDGGPEYDAARSGLEAKYGLDPEERDPERTIWIYRMDPRRR